VPIAYITHPDCLLHDAGEGHPEQPARLRAIQDQLISSGMELILRQFDAPLAEVAELERAHDPAYVHQLFTLAPQTGVVRLDSDTIMTPHTLTAARRAAGAVIQGVDLVMTPDFRVAFCAVRPPGHHAGPARAMGFCYFNNIAVGATHALARYGLERIAIADFDLHHGNGTEEIFRREPRVLLCSSFQHPYYPYSDSDSSDHIIKTPLAAGSGGDEFRRRLEADWLPALEQFRPQLLMISAGFDGHAEDEMGQLRLREADYHWISAQLKGIADRHAEGRIVSTLEGGYALSALGRSVVAHLDALLGNGQPTAR
jgi:acetoin utilization deacetylase AcuC-like enzyme